MKRLRSLANRLFSELKTFSRLLIVRMSFILSGSTKILVDSSDGKELFRLMKTLYPQPTQFGLIRLGGEGDGGYVLPDDLEGIEYCFSPGVADSSTFEEALAEKGITSFLADFSVDAAPISNSHISFDKLYVGPNEDEQKIIRLEDWILSKNLSESAEFILQMDIEGDELGVILDTPKDVWRRFRIVILEIHFLVELAGSAIGFRMLDQCLSRLLSEFYVAHAHVNNVGGLVSLGRNNVPELLELSLIRKDRVNPELGLIPTLLPHPLDQPNRHGVRTLSIPKSWSV